MTSAPASDRGGRELVRRYLPSGSHRSNRSIDRAVAGIQAQVERVSQFSDSIDLAASVQATRRIEQLLQPRLPELRTAVGLPAKPPLFARRRTHRACRTGADAPAPTGQVFTFWNSPLETAPPLVQACVAQLRRVYPDVRVLDGASVRDLIEIPGRIADLLEHDRPAHFSDYVRTRLLEEHGGIWADATVWLTRSIDDQLPRYLAGGAVLPRWTATGIANWFIASRPGTPLLGLQRRALEAWWNAHDDLPDYFLYHRIFEVLHSLVPELRGRWDAAPRLSALEAHRLQLAMMQPWRPDVVERMLADAPLQKLSYKYDHVPPGSTLEHLLRSVPKR